MSDEKEYIEETEEKKELEVVKGDGKGLNISPAYDHLNDILPEDAKDGKKPKNIVVPKPMKKEKKN